MATDDDGDGRHWGDAYPTHHPTRGAPQPPAPARATPTAAAGAVKTKQRKRKRRRKREPTDRCEP